jgi:hypothetical protein
MTVHLPIVVLAAVAAHLPIVVLADVVACLLIVVVGASLFLRRNL